MTKTTKSEAVLSRRKMLGRIGILAAVGYTVPAFTTLSMAHASGASAGGSTGSGASTSTPSTSTPSASAVEATCGPANPGDPDYDQCLVDNGFTV